MQLRVPLGKSEQVRFLADVQNLEVKRVIADAKVIINARTGSVVMNRDVVLGSCAIAQGNLSVTVDSQVNVSQPNTPFAGGSTVVSRNTSVNVNEKGGSLQKSTPVLASMK